MNVDVLVIGGGIAGVSAALEARRRGASVLLVTGHPGATALAGGAWDVAPLPALSRDELVSPRQSVEAAVRAFTDAHAYHPYARVHGGFLPMLKESHESFMRSVPIYRPIVWHGAGELISTDLGLLRRSATSQLAVLPLDAYGNGSVVVVEDDSPSVEAHTVMLGRSFPMTVRPKLYGLRSRAESAPAHARLVAPSMSREALERGNDGSVIGEWVATLASAQSARLDVAMTNALSALAITKHVGRVQQLDMSDPRDVLVTIENYQRIIAHSVILATGKFIGGGVEARSQRFIEPLTRAPLYADGTPLKLPTNDFGYDPMEVFGPDPFKSRMGHRVGVGYDGAMRVLAAPATPVHPRIFAAGAVLNGFDPSRDGTGFGTCVLTGWLAALHATRA